jgi:hypothetical protein
VRLRLAAALSIASGAAAACALPAGGVRLESERYAMVMSTEPDAIAVGKFFAVVLVLCPKGEAPMPEALRVDATMPAHRHGMNYRPRLSGEGGRYRAEGLMFHMPGQWEFVVELRAGGRSERATLARRIE